MNKLRRRDPVELRNEAVAGDFNEDVCAWLQCAFQRDLENPGEMPLERRLGLPKGSGAQKLRRDLWLRRAYALCAGQTSRARAEQLAREIGSFSRIAARIAPAGPLQEGKLSALRRALLAASRQGTSMPRSVRQLLRICDKTSPNLSQPQDYAEGVESDLELETK